MMPPPKPLESAPEIRALREEVAELRELSRFLRGEVVRIREAIGQRDVAMLEYAKTVDGWGRSQRELVAAVHDLSSPLIPEAHKELLRLELAEVARRG